jgi:hypothetical protein
MRLRRASRLAFLLAFAAVAPLGIALGQTAPGSPIVSDLPVASGIERVLFLETPVVCALLVMLPGSDGSSAWTAEAASTTLAEISWCGRSANGSRRDLT